MEHIDPELLALIALGEPVATSETDRHLDACDECADNLAGLRRAALAGRATLDAGDLERPREVVWERIAAELALGRSAVPAAPVPDAAPTTPAPAPPRAAASRHSAKRRRPGRSWGLAAAALLVAGAGLGTWAWTSSTTPTEVAQASLAAFPDHPGARGSAVVEENPDGSRFVRVEVSADAAPDTYREVWLIAADASELVSLGVLDDDAGTLTVPAGVDLARFPVVDVSQEPVDGDPDHSGDSIVRGELSFS
ncbi:anti-sigma-K factor rskA [Microbacterium sp. AG1240]|uniref:anti-sigma factor n=1 Tax=Microbacterium sp. AG1240 TaxID=2183992 RepID=UPI000EAE8F19|nr:anti-sigma factor [Microbacterium sp. AG1240]RKT33141.1 anti-sigma-K factor rskA [Microbacterium sp. AG1240]